MRAKVAEFDESAKGAKKAVDDETMADAKEGEKKSEVQKDEDTQMDVDDGAKEDVKEASAPPPAPAPVSVPAVPTQPDEVDAVEY